MPLVSAINLCHAYGQSIVLDGATFVIEAGERVGVVGRNGSGKSTLLKAMAGLLKPDSGEIQAQRGVRVGYLRQDPELDPDETLRDAAEGAFAELHALHGQLHAIFEEMATAEGAALETLLKRQERLETQIEAAGGYAIDHRIDATLHGLGFTDAQFGIRCGDLSGGQRGRLALARLLLEEPDVLLLDEPTNHLDLNARLWLESFLRDEYRGAVALISHDRYLLDNVVHRIAEVEAGRLIDYPGNYAKFRELRLERRITQARAYEKQQTDFKRQAAYIRKYKAGQRAKEAKGREKKLERAKQETSIERPLELETFSLELPKAPRTGERVISARGITKTYNNTDPRSGEPTGEKVLFRDLDVAISRGERWGIIGPNGAGKTTLVRTLLGEQPADSGESRLGSNVMIGHFKQSEAGLDLDLPVYRFLQKAIKDENPNTLMSEQQARDLAGAFLFSGDDQEKQMRDLSGGERSRARLAALLASAKNVLILDEPTNHLDIPSAERLEEALTTDPKRGGFDGTLLLISHDRALIDAACDHLTVLDGSGGAEIFLGNYSDWARKQGERAAERAQVDEARKRQGAEQSKRERQKAHQQREAAQKVKTASNGLAKMSTSRLETRIEEIEGRLRAIDAELGDPEVWRDGGRSSKLSEERSALSAELEPLEFEWSRRAEEG